MFFVRAKCISCAAASLVILRQSLLQAKPTDRTYESGNKVSHLNKDLYIPRRGRIFVLLIARIYTVRERERTRESAPLHERIIHFFTSYATINFHKNIHALLSSDVNIF